MRELYVYYRVTESAADGVLAVVRRVIAQLRAEHPGLQARLLRRPARAGEAQTWMEIWTHSRGIDATLQAQIETQAVAALGEAVDGTRHVEVFEPIGVSAPQP